MKRLFLIFTIFWGLQGYAQDAFQQWKNALQYDLQTFDEAQADQLYKCLIDCYKPQPFPENVVRSTFLDSLENDRRRQNRDKVKLIHRESRKCKTGQQYLNVGIQLVELQSRSEGTREKIVRFKEDSILSVLALHYYKKAYRCAECADDAVDALFRIGELHHLEGNNKTALELFKYSLLIETGEGRLRCQSLWGIIRSLYSGESMIDKDIAKQILPYYKEFVNLYLELFSENVGPCIHFMSELGYISKVAGDSDYIDYCRTAIHSANINNRATYIFLSNILTPIGYIKSPNVILGDYYATIGKYDQALRQYETAHIVKEDDFIATAPDDIYHYFDNHTDPPIYSQSLSYPVHINKLAAVKYNLKDSKYIEYLNESYCTAIRKLIRTFLLDVQEIREYQFRMYQPILAAQYNNPDAKWAYNAALFIKGATNNAVLDIKTRHTNADGSLSDVYMEYLRLNESYQKNRNQYTQMLLQKQELKLLQGGLFSDKSSNSLQYIYRDIQKVVNVKNVCTIEFVDAPSFSDDEETYYALIINNNISEPAKIELCSQSELEKIYKQQYRAYSIYSKQLYNLIWSKLEPYINEGDEVYFSPSGLLHQMNIEVLQDGNGKLVNDKYRLHRVSSTRELCIDRPKIEHTSAVLYGGLTYDMDSTALLAQSRVYSHTDDYIAIRGFVADSTQQRGSWSPLNAAEDEVRTISTELNRHQIKTTKYIHTFGTEESFKTLSGKKISIIHLATHGFFYTNEEAQKKSYFERLNTDLGVARPDNSLKRSGLILAGAQLAWDGQPIPDRVEDGILLAEEIAAMDLSGTDLVVLSACETGLGEITSEGVFGLQRAFKKAGVRTLIMSLWKVDDAATSLMMRTFYEHLLAGKSKREAFAIAQLAVKSEYKDPYYWASFIMLD